MTGAFIDTKGGNQM